MAGGGRIKGITIELDGDTKGLRSALKDVNKSSKNTQSELKEVERALKLDPSNVQLVNQKMDVLADAVNGASNKLKVLKQAQAQVEQQFARGEIGEEQYRAFQRELIETESAMKQYQSQMGNIQNEQKRLGDTTRAMGAFFDATGTKVEDFASTLGTRLTSAIQSGTATADQMEKALRLMGQRALGAGTDIDAMRDALNGINSGNSIDQVRDSLMSLNQSVVTTQDELKQVEQLLKMNPGNTTALAQKQQLLTQAISETTTELQSLQQRQQQVEAAFASGDMGADEYRAFQREIAQTEQSLAEYDAALRGMGSEMTRYNQAQQAMQNYMNATAQTIDDLSSSLGSQLTNAIRSGSASSDQLEQALRRIGQQAGQSGADLERFQRIVRNVDGSNSLDQIRRDLEQIEDAADQAESKMKGLGDSISGALGGLVAGGGLAGAVSAALSDSDVKAIIDVTFDVPESSKASVLEAVRGVQTYGVDAEAALEGVRRQWALNGDASDESNARVVQSAGVIAKSFSTIDFSELIQEANEIGKALNISTEDAMALTNALLKSGFPPEQIDIIAEYGTQLEMAGFNAEEIQAVMAAGVETGTWNIDNLLDGLKEGRIKAAEFGQEVPKALTELLSKTDMSTAQIKTWGQAVAAGGQEGTVAMQEMAQWLSTIEDDTLRNALGTELYGTKWEDQGANIIDTLTNMGNHMQTAEQNTQGMNESINGIDSSAMVQMQTAIQNMMTSLGPVFEKIAEVVTKIAEWVAANPQLAATIVAITTAVGILVGILAVIMPVISAVAAIFGVGMAAAGGIFIAIIAGIIAAVVAVVAIIQNWGAIVEWVKGIWAALGPFLSGLWSGIVAAATTIFSALGTFFVSIWTAITTTAQVIWTGFLAMVSAIWSGIVSAATTIWGMLTAILSGIWSGIVAVATAVWSGLSTFFSGLWTGIVSLATSMWSGFTGMLSGIWSGIVAVATAVFSALSTFFSTVWSGISSVATAAWNGIKAAITVAINAIKTVVTTVFNGIKTVVTTVFNGVKTVATTVWNGIKAAITTAVNGIKTVVTTVFNGIKTVVTTAFNAIKSVATSVWNGIKSVVTSAVNGIKSVVTSVFNSIKSVVTSAMNGVKSIITSVWNSAKSVVTSAVNGIKSIVTSVFNSLKSVVTSAMNGVKTAITNGWNAAKSFLQSINLASIGKNIIQGLANGISGAVGLVKNAVSKLAGLIPSWAKEMLGIHSPSRVMRDEVGYWVGVGVAAGVDKSQSRVAQSMQDLGYILIDEADHWAEEVIKIDEALAKDQADALTSKNEAIAKLTEAAGEKVKAVQKKAADAKRKLTKEENAEIEKLNKTLWTAQAKETAKYNEQIKKLEQKASKDKIKNLQSESKAYLDTVKSFIDDKKSLDQLSMVEEVAIWKNSIALFEESSKERIQAQQNYKKALEAINKEVESINKTHQDEMQKINDNLKKQTEDLTKVYEDEYAKRVDSLKSSAGDTFTELKLDMDVTGSDLTKILMDQVDAMTKFDTGIRKLKTRAIATELFDEISAAGVKALPELTALLNMTDEEMQHYSNIYEQKHRRAVQLATDELRPLKESTEAQIKALQQVANNELTVLQNEWVSQIQAITKATDDEMSSLKQIGIDAAKGLYDGLEEMEDPLIRKAREIADAVSGTIQKALDIHSPSRVMKGFGINIGEGLIVGMDDMIQKVAASSSRLNDAVLSAQDSLSYSASRAQQQKVIERQIVQQQTPQIDLDSLVQAIAVLAQRPVETKLVVDGREVAQAVSKHQYNATKLSGLTRGVNM